MKLTPNDGVGGSEDRRGKVTFPVPPSPRSSIVVLGIDPGLATTGWGVVQKQGNALSLLGLGAIETSAGLPLADRLLTLQNQVATLLIQFQPQAVAMEQLFFTKFATSIAATAQARGVILVTVAAQHLPVFELNPRHVKMAITGYGSADKSQIQKSVQVYFSLPTLPTPDDAADAVAMAVAHLQTRPGVPAPVTRRSKAKWEAEMLARSLGARV